MPANQFEINARRQKASLLVAELDRLVRMCGLDPSDDSRLVLSIIGKWSEEHWASISLAIGKRKPSPATRALVIEAFILRGRKAS